MQGVWRVHGPPSEQKLATMASFIDNLIAVHGWDANSCTFKWNRKDETLAHYLDRLPKFGEFAATTKIIHRAAMMTSNASELDTHPKEHFGVGAAVYARFSSPMREVVGVFVHKEAAELLGLQPPRDPAEDERTRDSVVRAGNMAKRIQSEITKAANRLAIDNVLASDLQWSPSMRPLRRGVVLGISSDKSRIYVEVLKSFCCKLSIQAR